MRHYKIEFEKGEPQQCMPRKEIDFTQQEQVIDMEIDKLLIEGVTSIRKLHILIFQEQKKMLRLTKNHMFSQTTRSK